MSARITDEAPADMEKQHRSSLVVVCPSLPASVEDSVPEGPSEMT